MGGIVVERGTFPWDNGKFPQMTEASRGYHGVRFFETFGDFGFTMKARMETMRTLGPTLVAVVRVPAAAGHRDAAPANAAALRVGAGRGDAPVRASGRRLGAPIRRCRATATRNSRDATCRAAPAASCRSAFAAAPQAGVRFIESVQFLSHLANVGDAKSLVIHPASTTHRQLDEAEQRAAGVSPEMIRLSIGLETLADILWDIDAALERSQSGTVPLRP